MSESVTGHAPGGEDLRQFCEALANAYPRAVSLERMVQFRLDVNLEKVAGTGPLEEVVFRLVQWSIAAERFDELVAESHAFNPGNRALREFFQKWRDRPTGNLPGSTVGKPMSQPTIDKESWDDLSNQMSRYRSWLALHRDFERIALHLEVVRGLLFHDPHSPQGSSGAARPGEDDWLYELEEFWSHHSSILIWKRIRGLERGPRERAFFGHPRIDFFVGKLERATDDFDRVLDYYPAATQLSLRLGDLSEALCRLEQTCAVLLGQSAWCLTRAAGLLHQQVQARQGSSGASAATTLAVAVAADPILGAVHTPGSPGSWQATGG
jgi:hypothetical protein